MGLLQTDKVKREVTKPLQKPNTLVNVTEAINIKGKKGYHGGWESHHQVGVLAKTAGNFDCFPLLVFCTFAANL